MSLNDLMAKLVAELPLLPREELERRIVSAFNGLILVDVMIEAKMALFVSVLVANIHSAQKDLLGVPGATSQYVRVNVQEESMGATGKYCHTAIPIVQDSFLPGLIERLLRGEVF